MLLLFPEMGFEINSFSYIFIFKASKIIKILEL